MIILFDSPEHQASFKEFRNNFTEDYMMQVQEDVEKILSDYTQMDLSNIIINQTMSIERDSTLDEMHFYLQPLPPFGNGIYAEHKAVALLAKKLKSKILTHIYYTDRKEFLNHIYVPQSTIIDSNGKYALEYDIVISFEQDRHYFNIDYNHFLQSEVWRVKRNEILAKDGFKCQSCHSHKNLQVHHLTYDRIGFEKDDDLVTLCKNCHSKIHKP